MHCMPNQTFVWKKRIFMQLKNCYVFLPTKFWIQGGHRKVFKEVYVIFKSFFQPVQGHDLTLFDLPYGSKLFESFHKICFHNGFTQPSDMDDRRNRDFVMTSPCILATTEQRHLKFNTERGTLLSLTKTVWQT